MFFSYFPLFSEADSSQGGLKTVTWSPATRAKFADVLTYDYMSEEDTDPTHPQRQRTVIPFAWESAELRMMKVQLDNHETALSIAKGKGVRQPWPGISMIGLVNSQDQRMLRLGHTPNWKEHTGTLERVFFVKSTVDSPPKIKALRHLGGFHKIINK